MYKNTYYSTLLKFQESFELRRHNFLEQMENTPEPKPIIIIDLTQDEECVGVIDLTGDSDSEAMTQVSDDSSCSHTLVDSDEEDAAEEYPCPEEDQEWFGEELDVENSVLFNEKFVDYVDELLMEMECEMEREMHNLIEHVK